MSSHHGKQNKCGLMSACLLLVAAMVLVPARSECPGGDENHLIGPVVSTWIQNFTNAWAGECCTQELANDGVCLSACILPDDEQTCWHGDNPYRVNKTCVEDWGGTYHHLTSCMALGYDPGIKDFTSNTTAAVMLGPKIANFIRVNYTNKYITPCPAAQTIPAVIETAVKNFTHEWAGYCCGQNVSFDGVCMSSCVLEGECWQGDNPHHCNKTCTEWGGTFHMFEDCTHSGYGGGRKTFDYTSDVAVFVGPRFLPAPTAPIFPTPAPIEPTVGATPAPVTDEPSVTPTISPSTLPSSDPSVSPSSDPSALPSVEPSAFPSTHPSGSPSTEPSFLDVQQEILDLLDSFKDVANAIPSSGYKQPQLKILLQQKADNVIADVQSNNYSAAMTEINTYISPKMDGCEATGSAGFDDWITGCPDQAALNGVLFEIIYYLTL